MTDYTAVKRLVSSISALRETHDHHSPVVSVLAEKLATVAGLSVDQIASIGAGAHLHDIGKIMVRRELLNATRKLTKVEIVEAHTHAELGWVIVDQAGFEPTICEITRHHHERYDGNGYPDRLRGEQIPLGARITSICDVYGALTSDRSYRKAYTLKFAVNFMQSERGKAFDPQLLDLFFDQVIK